MSKEMIGPSLGVGESISELNGYKRFWGKLVWKHEASLCLFVIVLAISCILVLGAKPVGVIMPSFLIVFFLTLFALTVFMLAHLIFGLKWRDCLPECKFEKIIKCAELLSKTSLILNNPKAVEQLQVLMDKTSCRNMYKLADWMKNFQEHTELQSYIQSVKMEYRSLGGPEKRLQKLKEFLQI